MTNQKIARVANQLKIHHAGSKNVPVILIGTSRTRSGLRFRPKQAAPAPAPVEDEPVPVIPVQPMSPAQAAAEAISSEPASEESENTYVAADSASEEPECAYVAGCTGLACNHHLEEASTARMRIERRWFFDNATGWYRRVYWV